MKHTEKEIQFLKEEVKLMWMLIISQLENVKKALLNHDKTIAAEIIKHEIDVNTFELKIDSRCENFIALYSPVAIDLRLTLSLIRISAELERIGDFATGIARFVIKNECNNLIPELKENLRIENMFDLLIGMLLEGFVAFESEQTKVSEKIISKDNEVDEIYHNAFEVLATYLKTHPSEASCLFQMLLLIKKLERVGDHHNNIVEEIVFFVDAKVLKHIGKSSDSNDN